MKPTNNNLSMRQVGRERARESERERWKEREGGPNNCGTLILQNIVSFKGLFCKRDLYLKEPTNRSHLIIVVAIVGKDGVELQNKCVCAWERERERERASARK